jgi:hypothetical protein
MNWFQILIVNTADLYVAILSLVGFRLVPRSFWRGVVDTASGSERVEEAFDFLAVCGGWVVGLLSVTCVLVGSTLPARLACRGGCLLLMLVLGTVTVRLWTGGVDEFYCRAPWVRLLFRLVPLCLVLAKVVLGEVLVREGV